MTESRTYAGRAWITFVGAGGSQEERAAVTRALGDRINDKTWVGHVEVTLIWGTKGWRVEATAYPSGVSVRAMGDPLPPPPEPWNATEVIRKHLREARIPLETSATLLPQGTDPLDHRVDQIEELQGWEARPVYFLQAAPPRGPLTIAGFHTEVRRALVNPGVLRPGGFALRWHTDPETREGGCVVRSKDGLSWVDPDGSTTQALVISDDSHLGWYYNSGKPQGSPLILHPVAVVETTLEFFRFIHQQLRPRVAEGGWTYRVVGRRLLTGKVALPPGREAVRELLWEQPLPLASSDDWKRELGDVGIPEEDAYIALCEFYGLFGLGPNAIPLVEDGRVSDKMLLALRG